MKILKNLKEIIEHSDGEEFVLDLNDLSNEDYIKALYFFSGLTYKNGSLTKLKNKVYRISI